MINLNLKDQKRVLTRLYKVGESQKKNLEWN